MPRPKVASKKVSAETIAADMKAERPDLEPSDYLFMLLAQRVGRVIDAVDERHCRADFGLSAAEMRVLFALRRSGPTYALRPTELFRALLITSGAISKQVDRLVASGHVDRQPGPDGSGGALIHLTPKGFEVADAALTSLADSSVVSQSALTVDERNTLSMLLGKMLDDLGRKLKAAEQDNVDS